MQYNDPNVTFPVLNVTSPATSLGCWKDGDPRRMSLLWYSPNMTNTFCAYLAQLDGYQYAATQYYHECCECC